MDRGAWPCSTHFTTPLGEDQLVGEAMPDEDLPAVVTERGEVGVVGGYD
jgi:hypothetical protein